MKKNPLVSVIIPAYNSEKYIKEAIESVLYQTYDHLEIIIVNDGSWDNTEKIVKEFKDSRIKYFWQKNKGIASAKNAGIKNAKGEFITFLDTDDFYLPRKIEEEVIFLKHHPEFDLVYCNMKHFSDGKPGILMQHKGPFYSGKVFEKLLHRFFGQQDTILIPKEIFKTVGFFDEALRYSEDWDMHLRIAYKGFKFGFLNKDLVRIRVGKNSLSRLENQWDMKKHALKVFKKIATLMTEEEKKSYKIDKIINQTKLKLAFAYLVVGRKKDCRKTLFDFSKNKFEKIMIYFLVAFIWLMPSKLLSLMTKKVWQLKQRMLFKQV